MKLDPRFQRRLQSPAPEERKKIAHGVSRRGKDAMEQSPGTGRKTLPPALFRPVPGLGGATGFHTAHAVGYFLSPFGLEASR